MAPIAAPGGYEWVELRCWDYPRVFIPLLLRASGGGGGGAHDALASAAAANLYDISGWELTDEDGNTYEIPEALPPLPPGGYVVVYFDGQGPGSDDYVVSDGTATLHTSALIDVFEDDADQVALYGPGGIVDFVPYGDLPGADGAAAAEAGIWHAELFVGPTEQIPGGEVLGEGGSIGLFPGGDRNGVDDWAIYGPGETTPGEDNPAPAPYFRSPPPSIFTIDHRIPFGWSTVADSVGYRFQLDQADDFSSPVISTVLTTTVYIPTGELADDTYYYRVRAERADGTFSAWSGVGEVTVFSRPAPSGTEVVAQTAVTLAVTPRLQHKDSRMLCVDGHHRDGTDRWDQAHEITGTPQRSTLHDNWYCTRASIAMIVEYHAGSLSQDRISYYNYGGGDPEGDLGHGIGMWPDELCTKGTSNWGRGDVFSWTMQGTDIDCARGKPTFAEVQDWIDSWRPCLFVENGDAHSTVMAGYDTNGDLVYRVDPWTATASWISYDTWDVTEYHCPGQDAPRDDEDSLTTDTDTDGIVDFDEENRLGTSEDESDSDDDGVNDKWDLYEVYFNARGDHAPNALGADMDNDGLRKEVDPDNDDGGSLDGCEDYDDDGRRDVGETSNFNSNDDRPCVPVMDRVYTTDFSDTAKSEFRPGEAVVLWLVGVNHTPEAFTGVDYNWTTYDPSGVEVADLSYDTWNVDMPPGEDEWWWISNGVPDDAELGAYYYSGTVSHGSSEDTKGVTFTVSGEPISITLLNALTCKNVEGNLPVNATADFNKSVDERVYAWAAWEGATRPAAHAVEWGFYRPSGSLWFSDTFAFTPTVSVYYTWYWLPTENMDNGTWTVRVRIDGAYITALTFKLASGSSSVLRPRPFSGDPGGGGGGVAPPSARTPALMPSASGGKRRR